MDVGQIKAQFPGYAGWNDSAAIQADFRATGGSGKGPSQPSGGGGGGNIDIVGQAQKLNEFYKTQNQPSISTLGSQVNPNDPNSLQARYDSIISSIKGQGTVASNQQTLATNNLLSQRGISSDSPYYQQQMVQSLLPVNTQIAGLLSNTGLAEQNSINMVQNAIAQLQAGNPESSVNSATTLAGQQSALQGQQAYAQAILQAAQAGANKPFETQPGQNVYNPSNQSFKTSPLPSFSTGNTPPPSPSPSPTPKPAINYSTFYDPFTIEASKALNLNQDKSGKLSLPGLTFNY